MADRKPTSNEAAAIGAELQKQAKYGGAVDATPGLAAGLIGARALGPLGTAVTTMGTQTWKEPIPGTKTLGVPKFVGIPRAEAETENLEAPGFGTPMPGVPNLAQMVLAVKENKLPSWFRAFLRSTPEDKILSTIKETWNRIGAGASRQAFEKGGVIAKLPVDPSIRGVSEEAIQNFQAPSKVNTIAEFMNFLQNRAKGFRGQTVVTPKPLALSTKTGISFVQKQPEDKIMRRAIRSQDDPEFLKLRTQVQDRVRHEKLEDVDPYSMHNWLVTDPKTGPKKALLYDSGEVAIKNSPFMTEALKDNPTLGAYADASRRIQERHIGPTKDLSPAAEKLLSIMQTGPKATAAGR